MSKTYNSLIYNLIDEFYERNSNIPYGYPLIGFSDGLDDIYRFFKEDIGEFYWTPIEAFNIEFDNNIENKLSVISFVFPHLKVVKNAHVKEDYYTSKLWAENRIVGQEFINQLMRFLVQELNKRNIRTMCPFLNDNWKNYKTEKYIYASSWSERHTAFASGLGTFGLCDGLITSVGKAHRCSSIILDANMEYSERSYETHMEYCLFYANDSCEDCINRCPVGAISEKGHDKLKCRAYQRNVLKPHIAKHYNLISSSCGLCQVGVACESKIPTYSK